MKPVNVIRHIAGICLMTMILIRSDAVLSNSDVHQIFIQYCSVCHGPDRLGSIGPALLPENLTRLKKPAAIEVVSNGRPATQMPAFNSTLDQEQIQSLIDYIYTPLEKTPEWGEAQITASRLIHKPELLEQAAESLPPLFDADPMNLFLVVEAGDHHVTVLDGDKFEPIYRFKSQYALHGGPKYSSTGRYVYFASRDGWISKFDMYRLEVIAEIKAGINTRNAAVSSDDRYVLVGNYLPHNMVLLDAHDLSLIKVIPAIGKNGDSSRVSAVYDAAPRQSFMIALKDLKEIWELNYSDNPPQGFSAEWVHDYRKDSGEVEQEQLPVRKMSLDQFLDDFFFDQEYVRLIGSSRDGGSVVFDLDLKRATHTLDLQGMPHLSSGITWKYKDTTVLATPNIRKGEVSIIDMKDWTTIKRIETMGPGFFLRSHENSHYAWVDVFFGPNKDIMHVIDKRTLEIVKTLKPSPGKTSAHIEFTKDGSHALLSIWEQEGELIVYDANTLTEVKRLPMKKPVGKYNVHNKISRSEGTSH